MRLFPEQEANAVIQVICSYFLSAKADEKDNSINKELIIEVILGS